MYIVVDEIGIEKESGRIYVAYSVWSTQADFDELRPPVYRNDHLIDSERLPESDVRFRRNRSGDYMLKSGETWTEARLIDEMKLYRRGLRSNPLAEIDSETVKLNLDEVLMNEIIKPHLETVDFSVRRRDERGRFEIKNAGPEDKSERLKKMIGSGVEVLTKHERKMKAKMQ
jgi:hypothetical protein